ncbi:MULTISPECIES: pilus assembly PilX family protein [Dyella]|uniref:Type 4 fimbrial biogenesis protein PilX N-terminal domain-containing protein n=2 Tax=Dyella TaxID=231454 RepID=A0A4R0YSU6_9GAMM|nr:MULTISPECIES: pilus assembly PilX N-terminal domain-containing protein [Dyella]TBR40004.1 hypothetical protein EYV96_07430 [Dyella terrae]TCI12415.1 hypothetical protein EZM97_03440 [Dyella soli]
MNHLTYATLRMRHRQRGVALLVGLIFLVMLTLVSIVVMRGTMLEMHLSTATARHEQAFEASETTRAIPEVVINDHVFNRGWPKAWGGDVPDGMFDLNTSFANRTAWVDLLKPNSTAKTGLQDYCGGTSLAIFYLPQSCSSHDTTYNYAPSKWDSTVVMSVCEGTTTQSCSSSQQVNSKIAIVRDGVMPNAGSGGAQAQGYSSPGIGTATGGASLLLQIRSQATVPGNGQAATIAQYKQVITH